nr:hypothetical protein [Candidatus Sigynarchaeota archaeon]
MPARNEITISIHELQVLANMFESIEIGYPCIKDFTLLEAKPQPGGYQLDVQNPNFALLEEDINDHNESPHFNDFRECFMAAGCIKYDNVEDFQKFYKNLKNQAGFPKPTYFVPDSNILYHRFITNASSPIKD